jgi:hypothetical protein
VCGRRERRLLTGVSNVERAAATDYLIGRG